MKQFEEMNNIELEEVNGGNPGIIGGILIVAITAGVAYYNGQNRATNDINNGNYDQSEGKTYNATTVGLHESSRGNKHAGGGVEF